MRLRTLVFLVLVLSLPLAGQTTKKTDHKPPEKKQAAITPEAKPATETQPVLQPSPEMRKLWSALVGRWKVSGKILDEQWAPGGASGAGSETVRRGPKGFSIISDAQMDFGKMGPFAGHGVIFWDAKQQAYTGFWCDSWTPTCEPTGLGKWEGDKLVFNSEMPMGEQKVPVRQTYSNFSKEGFDWSMETGDGKGAWKPAMSLKYERSGPAAPSGLSTKPDAAPPKQ